MGNEGGIVGGMFGLTQVEYPRRRLPPFLGKRNIFLANARSGISLLVDLLSPSQIWMPSYLCSVMLKAVRNPLLVKFYEVSYNLDIPDLHWLDDVKENDVVLFIDYFGFPLSRPYATAVKERGAWVLEDACQALLSGLGHFSDFILFSPRKFLGVPDGGLLVINNDEICLSGIRLETPPAEWWLKAFEATVLRRDFDQYGGGRRWFELFREADINGPIGFYSMSELSRLLLYYGFDYTSISQARIENYKVLGQILGKHALFPELADGVVPLGFPVCLKNRNYVRQVLFEYNIYPPIHWLIDEVVPFRFSASHRLANEILTLVCDQRYSRSDMDRMGEIVAGKAQ